MGGNAMFLLNIFWKTRHFVNYYYCESSNKPPESLFLSIKFYGGFNREGGGGGGYVVKQGTTLLFQTKRRWYHYLHKEHTYSSQKENVMQLKNTNLNFQHLNQTYWISSHEVLQLWWINTVYHWLIWLWRMRGKGRGGCLEERESSPYDGGG